MKRWLAVLGVLLAGALLLPQHAWSQGAIVNNGLVVNDGLQLQGTPLSIKFYDGTNTGTLQPATLTGNQTWTLPDASGTILLSSTIGTTAWVLGGNTLTSVQRLGTVSSHDLPIITNNTERMRITAAGDVVVQNQAGGTPTTVLRVLGGNGGAGATQVVLQAGANQSGVDLLQWQNNGGLPLGFIRPDGSVVVVYDPPTARQAFFGVAKPSGALLIGIGPDVASGGWGVGVYDDATGQLRAGMGKDGVSGEWRMGVGRLADQNGVLLSWKTSTTDNEPRIVVANGNLANPVFLVDREGDVTVRGTTVSLPNIPDNSAATEVLVWNAGNVQRRDVSGLIGTTAWVLGGNTLTSVQNLGTQSNHDLPIITNNVERMRITATGNVGIGTSSPAATLHVVGTAQVSGNTSVGGNLSVGGNGSVTGNLTVDGNTTLGDAAGDAVTVNAGTVALPNIPDNSAATEVLVWNAGNVQRRDVSGLIGTTAWLLGGNTLTSVQNLGTQSNHDLPIITNNVERMRITATGNVGIGTSSPAATLHVVGTAQVSGNTSVGGNLSVGGNGSVTGNLTVDGNTTLGDAAGDAVTVNAGTVALPNIPDNSAATEVLVWNSSGSKVERRAASGLIGTTAWVLGGNTLTSVQNLGTQSNHDLPIITNNVERMRITATGNVGIGTSSPAATLHVVGTAQVSGNTSVGGNLSVGGNGSVTGNLTVDGNTTLGDAAGDAVTVNAGTVALPNIPDNSAATEVLVWNSSGSKVERRAASGLIGTTAWLLGGNTLTSVQNLGTQSNHDLPIITNNVERMRITATGNVGIGTSSPAATLHVVGTAQVSGNTSVGGNLSVGGNGSVTGNLTVDGNTTLGDAAGDAVTVNAGTVALPNIPDNSAATEVLVWNSSGSKVERRAASGLIGTTAWVLGGNTLTSVQNLGTQSNHDLPIITNNVERMRITATGNVGIGTSSPAATLHVVGTAQVSGNTSVGGNLSVGGNGSVTGNLTVDGNTTLGDASGDAVTVNAGTVSLPNIPSGSTATEVLVWNSSGSKVERRSASGLIGAAGGWAVGGNAFGGTNSTQVLGTTTSDNLQIQTGGANAIYFNTNTNAGGDTVEAQLTSTGQLVFFTTGTPGFRVDLPNNSANAVGRIRATGISFWSSMRWKEDIRPIPNALEKALALRGVNFRWKPEYGGGEDMGFIMEEVDRVVPEVVQRDERTGELLGMDYARLTALLVEALKEEHRRNEALRAEVAELRSLVEQLLRQNGERGTSSQPSTIQDAWLGQNIPNPFAGTTTIPYYIPAGVSRAELVVRDVGGRELRRLELAERGAHGQVVLEMGLMGSGTYEYALVLDGRVVAVKQMTLVR